MGIFPSRESQSTHSVSKCHTPDSDVAHHSSSSSGGDQQGCSLRHSRVTQSRIIFLLCLCVVAVVLGYGAHQLLTDAETTLAREQFESIADRALDMSAKTAQRKRLGCVSMAGIAEQTFPDAVEWPMVYIKGFAAMAKNVQDTSEGQSFGLMPLVRPEQLQAYEDFCYDVVFNQSGYPNTTGISPWGKGVFGLDPDKPVAEQRYQVSQVNGTTKWGSPYNYSFPYLYHSKGPTVVLMGDMHSTEAFGAYLDHVVDCSAERARQYQANQTAPLLTCGGVTEIRTLNAGTKVAVKGGPGAVLFQPIYPANDKTVLAGVLSSTIIWDETLLNVFPSEVSGIDCVLTTQSQIYTYQIINGEAILLGEQDLHDPAYQQYAQTTALHPPGLYGYYSAHYTLTLYPNKVFFQVYSTSNPITATIGVLVVVLVVSCIFFFYDFFVRREFHTNHAIAEAKKTFVRYISHEVRTPLNAVCMGLQLLRDEIARLARSSPHAQEEDNVRSGHYLSDRHGLLLEKLRDWSDLSRDILSNSHGAVEVLNDILNYDKVESKTLHLELAAFSVWNLISSTASEFQLQAKACKIHYDICFVVDGSSQTDVEMEVDVDDIHNLEAQIPQDMKDLRVVADHARIAQCMRNLISNALKFTPENGSVAVRVAIKPSKSVTDSIKLHNGETVVYERSNSLILSVTDSGAGMTKAQLGKVFAQGVQFDVNKLQAGKGSGLGLYIAKGIIEQHGGVMTVDSPGLGLGTTFTMVLSLYDVPVDQRTEERKARKESFPGHLSEDDTSGPDDRDHSDKTLNILVVDDSAMNRKLLVRLLQNLGHTCTEAENGLVAVERVKEAMADKDKLFDSILMDCEMPGMDGPTAASTIRGMGCDSFIVGITGALFTEQVNHFVACGANRVLPKPLDMRALLEIWMEYEIL